MTQVAAGVAECLPAELSRLLLAAPPATTDRAWSDFLAAHNRLLLYVARSVGHDHDAAMDAYAHLLEQLRRDDYHRLRSYHPDGRTRFTTWLVVVARRVCLDFVRHKYGRFRSTRAVSVQERAVRRQLTDLLAVELDVESVAAEKGAGNPETDLLEAEQSANLAAAIARLEPADQLLLKLRFEDERWLKEIAPVLGFASALQVHRQLKRVLSRLRAVLAGSNKPSRETGVRDGSVHRAGPFNGRG